MRSILVGLIFYGLVQGNSGVDLLVSTNLGQIRGVRADDGEYTKFLGVPYALVNETNPFGPALPHPGYESIFEANDDTTVCVQLTPGGFAGTLQCLQLHIYVPDTANSQNLLPVMAYIHGGGFTGGSAAGEKPNTLIQNDVIFVSISYRLGVYGFLCLDTPEYPGNEGFKDQVLAFKWIRENIEAFGGDPTRVTALGQSAGGMAVNAHLYSEGEKVFDRAIIQSGPAVSTWFFVPSYPRAPFVLAEHLGYTATDMSDAITFLTNADPYQVTQAAYETELLSAMGPERSLVKPCVEQKFDGVEQFITEHPMNVRDAPKVNSTAIMIGYTDEEFGLEFYLPPSGDVYDNFEYMLSDGFVLGNALDKAVELVKDFYVGDEELIGLAFRQDIANFAADLVFEHATQRMAKQFVDNGASAVYRYIFSYIGDKNVTGASHGAELVFLFDENQFAPTPPKTEREVLLFNQTTKLWSNFAKYGNPTPEVTELLPVEWKPATKEEQFSLDINSELTLVSRPEYERMTFWDLFYQIYEEQQIGYKPIN